MSKAKFIITAYVCRSMNSLMVSRSTSPPPQNLSSSILLLTLPRHETPPFSKKLSALHWHWNDPLKFKHWSSQPPFANKHSSISVNENIIQL